MSIKEDGGDVGGGNEAGDEAGQQKVILMVSIKSESNGSNRITRPTFIRLTTNQVKRSNARFAG